MRNLDSKIHLPGFDPFKFQFHSFFAVTFSTASTHLCHLTADFAVMHNAAFLRRCGRV
jgi:hypothetical protein